MKKVQTNELNKNWQSRAVFVFGIRKLLVVDKFGAF
jgi:hypothetical protein